MEKNFIMWVFIICAHNCDKIKCGRSLARSTHGRDTKPIHKLKNPKGTNHQGDLLADDRIIFKWNSKKQDVRTWTELICLRMGYSGGFVLTR